MGSRDHNHTCDLIQSLLAFTVLSLRKRRHNVSCDAHFRGQTNQCGQRCPTSFRPRTSNPRWLRSEYLTFFCVERNLGIFRVGDDQGPVYSGPLRAHANQRMYMFGSARRLGLTEFAIGIRVGIHRAWRQIENCSGLTFVEHTAAIPSI